MVAVVVKNLANALSSIYFRVPRGMQFGLEDVRAACERVGSPHLGVPVLHIAGTNGKGSVASMLASVLSCSGYRVGLFTSPHLCRFSERIQIAGSPIDDELLTEMLWQAIEAGPSLSFFETTFLSAMLSFRARAVDVAVLEVGLGGRLDATNVVEHPLVTAITRIALDHMDKLGETEEQIALEKVGIAKQGVPMVLGPLSEPIERLCRQQALEAGASEVVAYDREYRVQRLEGHAVRVSLPAGDVGLRPCLKGDHQLQNAAVAAAIAESAARSLTSIDACSLSEGIARAQWAGRLEQVSDGLGPVLLDAAHNPDGVRALIRYLADQDTHTPEQRALVFGSLVDKSWKQMLQLLAPLAANRFYVEPGGRKSAALSELVSLQPGHEQASIGEALLAARRSIGPEGLILVAGSIFLAGNARAHLLNLERDPPVAL